MTVTPPAGGMFTPTDGSVTASQLAMSPDGRTLAFVASGADGVPQIWIRPLDSAIPHPVTGTQNGSYPFWSGNSRSLGFFAARELRRVDLDGGCAASHRGRHQRPRRHLGRG